MGCHSLLQDIFLSQGLNPDLPHCKQMLYPLSHQGSLLLGKKVLKSQGLGEGGQRAQTSIIKWVSYGDEMCSLVIVVNPTVLNIWKLIRDLNISYNKKKIVIVYVTPNPKIRGLECYRCAIASRASQCTELGTVCMYVSECLNTYLIIPLYLFIFKM